MAYYSAIKKEGNPAICDNIMNLEDHVKGGVSFRYINGAVEHVTGYAV